MTRKTEFHSANVCAMNGDITENWFHQFEKTTLTELNNPMCERFFRKRVLKSHITYESFLCSTHNPCVRVSRVFRNFYVFYI